MRMHLFIVIFGIYIFNACNASEFNPDYPNATICVVPNTRRSFKNSQFSYNYLRNVLGLHKRCTHIYGHLHVTYIGRLSNGSDPDMSFLESIEEISGSLILSGNSVRRIPFTNLRVIRGHSNGKEMSALKITHNYFNETNLLEDLDLRNLRVIMNKNVVVNNNPGLPYIEQMVNWNEIVDDPSVQKIQIAPSEKNITAKCHEECDFLNRQSTNGSAFCFGPSKDQCQQRTKCAHNKEYKWCKFTKGVETPCHYECAGGCFGKSSGDCLVCKDFLKNSNCTNTCSPKTKPILGLDDHRESTDKLIYTVGSLCSSRCPVSLLDQNKICIYECNFDKYYKSDHRCIECIDTDCQKQRGDNVICDLSKIDPSYPKNNRKYTLNKNALIKLTNCTTVLGALDIDDESFISKDVTLPLLYEHLKNVREIFGQLALTFHEYRVENFTFLPNLSELRNSIKSADVGSTLKIYSKDLSFLGLKSLTKVYGDVAIETGGVNCSLSREPWNDITNNIIIKSKCQEKCDPLCTRGCWGPGNKLCYACEFLKAGDSCVKQCSDTPGYYSHYIVPNNYSMSNIECRKCHPLCKQNCTGPTAKDCNKECLHATENGTCVDKCSYAYYPSKNISGHIKCKPCNNLCSFDRNGKKENHACSGPSDILGDGGCSMCDKIINTGKDAIRCHKGPCPTGYFKSSIPDNKNSDPRILHQSSCESCHKLCASCTHKGNHRSTCLSCKGFFHNDQCVSVCPNDVKIVTEKIESGGECPKCHSECKGGCLLANDSTKCHQCVNKKLFHDVKDNKFSCVTHCPANRNYTEYRDGNFLCLRLEDTSYSRQKRIYIYVSIACLFTVGILLILITIYFKWRYTQAKIKAEIKALYSNYKEPNLKNMKEDMFTKPPNMNRLQMIAVSDLIFDRTSKPLGSGAFGKVFSGYWKVTGNDNQVHNLKVVIKIIHNSSRGSTDEFLEEAKIMASVSHRHCLPLIGVCLSLEKPCLISTFAEHGSLDKYLHQHGRKISSYSMLKWAEQIADGMAYLNKVNIIHRDLAARNVLVNSKNIVQITDFGLARLIDDSEESIVVKSGRVPIRWLALETLLNATYSSASDVWAYGVTLWEIFTYGKRPYANLETSEIKVYLQQGNRLCQPEISTLEVYMVMIKCWLDDPHMRPSFSELMSNFEMFSLSPKRFLYLPHEYTKTKAPKSGEMINLRQISYDSDFKPILSSMNNKSDENSWGTTLQSDSAYHLIHNSYSKDQNDDKSFLPKRKKAKRNISLDRIKYFSKFDLNKILSSKSQRDSKSFQYPTTNTYEGNKTTSTSFESITPLFTQRSIDYDSQPVNPQIAKIKKETRQNSPLCDVPHKIDNSYKTSERHFIDKNVAAESECLLGTEQATKVDNKPVHTVVPLDIPNIFPRIRQNLDSKKLINEQLIENSPDSGNCQNFDIDDYLVPSRISSAGYYNVTPSPSTNAKQNIHFNDSPLLVVQNNDYVDDDGYLEPKRINQ